MTGVQTCALPTWHPLCISAPAEFTGGKFKEVIDDSEVDPSLVKKVLFCSGKVYYDLLEEKRKLEKKDIAIVRLEQLYPLPVMQLNAVVARYSQATHWEWVQEEPVNMGGWKYILINFTTVPLHHVARPASGSPATGSSRLHKIQQRLIVEKALGQCSCEHANGSCRLHCAEHENQII